jgi:preprotein translocase subunit SecD
VAPAYVKPPACGSQYLFTTATYIAQSGTSGAYNPGPGPDPALASVKSTPALEDTASRTVLVAGNPAATGAARYELGPVAYDGKIPATGAILGSASAQFDATQNGWIVNFTIKSQYSAFFDTIAKTNYHLPLAIDLGGYVESAPTINAQSFGGSGQISGGFTQSQAGDLALVLKYGQIPIALKTATYTTVSPTLGKHSLDAGLLAGLLGLLLVMGYTIFYYRSLGIVVVLGLVTTGALIYAIISLLGETSAGLTLDLSGMTGLIVSVGITVDSYIVYFERLKDEVRAGRSIRSSVDRGFKSAYRTILSADAVSFLGAFVLWILSIGAVRGFAFMLGLSTLVDVVTAYTFTRPLVILLGRNRVFTDARIFGVARGLAAPVEAGA